MNESVTPADDQAMAGHRKILLNSPAGHSAHSNRISTTKYTPITFVPLFLWDQFSKPANFYFLIISTLQQIPGLSPTGRWGTLLPLVLSLIVSAGKEIYEDISRSKEDESINKRKVLVIGEDETASVDLENIKVGQVVRILQDELIPADLVLLKSSEAHGLCFLETAAIDGETNLKLRQALTATETIDHFDGIAISCAAPNNEIYNFQGSIALPNSVNLPLDKNQFLPRGTILVNTEWILGVVIYTGTETKIMQNVKETGRRKFTKMDRLNDIQNAQIVAILFVLVAILFSGHVYYNRSILPAHWYLRVREPDDTFKFVWSYFANFVTFLLLLNNLVPISLSVTLEIVRSFLARLINNDLDMYDEEQHIPSKAQSSNVLDELGRIEYIMTDKTGTLTCNQMNLKSLMINGQVYNDFNTLLKALETESPASQSIQQFLEFLACCHTVMIDKRNGSFQASSPDEMALLVGAKELGISFISRTSEHVELEIFDGTVKSFEIKAIIEFTSERKRMSVVIYDKSAQKYFVVTKGADSVILPLCETNSIDTAEKCVEEFSIEGLRTLCFAYKELSAEQFSQWHGQWTEAVNTIGPLRQERLDSCVRDIEIGLEFLGVSGIEDELQDGVPKAIKTLTAANIKIWILTGDRAETATNTACLAGILKPHQTLIKLQDPESARQFITKPAVTESFVLLISGDAFAEILKDSELRKAFVPVAELARALISCRLSPLQKTEITHFVQNDLKKTTLAVGDGGNDVGMIQAADVGVGINGLEGTQAARSSDFSIAKFRFLVKLLLVHGAWSFHRISRVILYMMYKNFVIVLAQFFFALFNSFSAQSAFNPSLLMLYNAFFSAVPPALIGISDQYVTAPELIKHPQLYQFGQKGKFYDQKAFWECIANASVQSFTAAACFYLLIQVDPVLRNGKTLSLAFAGDIFYFIILTIISFKVLLFTNFFTRLMGIALISALLICAALISLKTPAAVLTSPLVYSAIILVTIATLLRDFAWKFYKRQFKPRAYHIVQEMRAVQRRRDKRQKKKELESEAKRKLNSDSRRKFSSSSSQNSESDLLNRI